MNNILQMQKLQDDCPVMVTGIPNQIQKEIDRWVNESKNFRNNPLYEIPINIVLSGEVKYPGIYFVGPPSFEVLVSTTGSSNIPIKYYPQVPSSIFLIL